MTKDNDEIPSPGGSSDESLHRAASIVVVKDGVSVGLDAVDRSHSNEEGDAYLLTSNPAAQGRIDYKCLSWRNASVLMLAETISLGILGLPQALASVGIVPGVILIVLLGATTWYTGYVIWQFVMRYGNAYNFASAAEIVVGRWGRLVVEVMQGLVLNFIMAAHVLSFSVMMNTIDQHHICTIVWMSVGALVSLCLTLPRTLKGQSILSVFSCMSIVTAIMIAIVGFASTNSPTNAMVVVPSTLTTFHKGALAVADMVMAFTSNIAFFHFIQEMKKPQDFPKALAVLQISTTTLYIIVSVLIYAYVGQSVKSPALDSAAPLIRKIAFGVAIPTILVAGVIVGNIASKNIYTIIWRDWKKRPGAMADKKWFSSSVGSWLLIVALLWATAFVIAAAIPVFSNLLGVIGAGLCIWFSIGLPAVFWMWLHKDDLTKSWKMVVLLIVHVVMLAICFVICGVGLYGSTLSITMDTTERAPFSCADNSV